MSTTRDQHRKLNYEDYVGLPEDGRRHEIVDGELFVNPAPNLYHQTVSRRLQFALYEQVELVGLGQIFDAPVDVQLSPVDIVQPDLVVVLVARQAILHPSRILGVPDLVIEILSPSTTRLDCVVKKSLYQRFEVPEYWIVDPEAHCIEPFHFEDGVYRSLGRVEREQRWNAVPVLCVDLFKVW